MPSEREKARRWWPQFGLRSLAVLFAVAGLLFWGVRKYADRINEKEKIAVAIAQVEEWGGEVTYEIPTPRGLPAKILLWCETAVLGEEFTARRGICGSR